MSWSPVLAPDRDDYFRRGTPVKSGTNYLHHGFGFASESNGATFTATNNRDTYVPYFIEHPVLVDQFSIHVQSAAGTTAHVGMYVADADLQPVGPPLFAWDADSSTTGLKTYAPSPPMRLSAGAYLAVVNPDAQIGIYCGQNDGGAYTQASASTGLTSPWMTNVYVTRTGALPTPGTAWGTTQSGAYGWRSFLGMRFVG